MRTVFKIFLSGMRFAFKARGNFHKTLLARRWAMVYITKANKGFYGPYPVSLFPVVSLISSPSTPRIRTFSVYNPSSLLSISPLRDILFNAFPRTIIIFLRSFHEMSIISFSFSFLFFHYIRCPILVPCTFPLFNSNSRSIFSRSSLTHSNAIVPLTYAASCRSHCCLFPRLSASVIYTRIPI